MSNEYNGATLIEYKIASKCDTFSVSTTLERGACTCHCTLAQLQLTDRLLHFQSMRSSTFAFSRAWEMLQGNFRRFRPQRHGGANLLVFHVDPSSVGSGAGVLCSAFLVD
jgi:hypothetical protein